MRGIGTGVCGSGVPVDRAQSGLAPESAARPTGGRGGLPHAPLLLWAGFSDRGLRFWPRRYVAGLAQGATTDRAVHTRLLLRPRRAGLERSESASANKQCDRGGAAYPVAQCGDSWTVCVGWPFLWRHERSYVRSSLPAGSGGHSSGGLNSSGPAETSPARTAEV